jgi:hypothetical protein
LDVVELLDFAEAIGFRPGDALKKLLAVVFGTHSSPRTPCILLKGAEDFDNFAEALRR